MAGFQSPGAGAVGSQSNGSWSPRGLISYCWKHPLRYKKKKYLDFSAFPTLQSLSLPPIGQTYIETRGWLGRGQRRGRREGVTGKCFYLETEQINRSKSIWKGKVRVSRGVYPSQPGEEPIWRGIPVNIVRERCGGFFWPVEWVVSTSPKDMKTCDVAASLFLPSLLCHWKDVFTKMSQAVGFQGGLGIFPMSAFAARNRSRGRWEDVAGGRQRGRSSGLCPRLSQSPTVWPGHLPLPPREPPFLPMQNEEVRPGHFLSPGCTLGWEIDDDVISPGKGSTLIFFKISLGDFLYLLSWDINYIPCNSLI